MVIYTSTDSPTGYMDLHRNAVTVVRADRPFRCASCGQMSGGTAYFQHVEYVQSRSQYCADCIVISSREVRVSTMQERIHEYLDYPGIRTTCSACRGIAYHVLRAQGGHKIWCPECQFSVDAPPDTGQYSEEMLSRAADLADILGQ